MDSKKINQKELNSEVTRAVMSDAERIEYLFATNWKKFTYAAIAIIVVASAAIWWYDREARLDKAARAALSAADTREELQSALETHGGHAHAAMARYRLARGYMAQGDYTNACKEFATVKAQGGQLGDIAALKEAYACEMGGDTAAAAQLFEAIGVNESCAPALRAEANYACGRLYAGQNQLDKAVAALNRQVGGTEAAAQQWNALSSQLIAAIYAGEFGEYSAPVL